MFNTFRVIAQFGVNTNRSSTAVCPVQHNLCMTKKGQGKAKKTKEAVAAGLRLRECRDAAGLTLKQLAELSGIYTGQGIGNYEQGTRHLKIKAAKILAPLVKSHAAYLMGLITEVELRVLLAFHAGQAASLPPSGGKPDSDENRPFVPIRRVAGHPSAPDI
jgi:transcriptional regulator with XRE-family HTH domain